MPENNLPTELLPERAAGVILHISSLPGPYGIGEIGSEARAFVDNLEAMRLKVWQFLPIGPTGYGDSPYQSLSTFAGNELLISINDLLTDGLLQEAEAKELTRLPEERVDFAILAPTKISLLLKAARRFRHRIMDDSHIILRDAYNAFVQSNNDLWLHDYARFRVLKSLHDSKAWYEWPNQYARRNQDALELLDDEHAHELDNYKVLQFLFDRQWRALRQYANNAGVRLFADIPIYVARDSADAWSNPELLQLDSSGNPLRVAGVPPDYFSEDGQLWGNPLFDWQYQSTTGYAWWIERLQSTMAKADMVRIDHFRGFDSYWSVPADADSARNGQWESGPGDEFFDVTRKALGALPIIAEDLGLITSGVEELRDRQQLPGMSVLQFMLDDPGFNVDHIPFNRVCYTGTHDNDTVLGWVLGGNDDRTTEEVNATRDKVLRITQGTEQTVVNDLIRLALSSPARIAIIPMQDLLGEGSSARMNTPGTSDGNWTWRVTKDQLSQDLVRHVAKMVRHSKRE